MPDGSQLPDRDTPGGLLARTDHNHLLQRASARSPARYHTPSADDPETPDCLEAKRAAGATWKRVPASRVVPYRDVCSWCAGTATPPDAEGNAHNALAATLEELDAGAVTPD